MCRRMNKPVDVTLTGYSGEVEAVAKNPFVRLVNVSKARDLARKYR